MPWEIPCRRYTTMVMYVVSVAVLKEKRRVEFWSGSPSPRFRRALYSDYRAVSPADAVISRSLKEQTRKVLATLTPRQERVLRLRFGIDESADHTLEEVGQDFGVTRERIRQVEAKALRKLRHPSRAKRLRPFVEG